MICFSQMMVRKDKVSMINIFDMMGPVPAGQGFWYISKGGAPAIDWKAIAAGK